MDFNDLIFNYNSSTIDYDDDSFIVYAHPNETLSDHISKTLTFFKQFSNNEILLNFYDKFLENNLISLSFDDFMKLIYNAVKFHDMGKLSFNFQINRLNKYNNKVKVNQNNFLVKYGLNKFISNFNLNHSSIGSLLFLLDNKNLDDDSWLVLLLSYIIWGHHTNLKDVNNEDDLFFNWDDIEIFSLSFISIFLNLNNGVKQLDQKLFQKFQRKAFGKLEEYFDKCNMEISAFYSYIYSLLIVSDIFASQNYNKFPNDIDYNMFNNRIDDSLFDKMNTSFFNVAYNKNLDFNEEIDFTTTNINDLRRYMLLESSKNLSNILDNDAECRVLFLNMPTGGGKTNTSMKLALDIISKTNVNRIIYAMPFINIIEQNFEELCKTFDLNEAENEIRKVYSGSEFIYDTSDEEKVELITNEEFFNFPIICTTFVSFFNTFIKNNKKNKYKLSSITNSVVILDEIQSLPLKNWNSLYYLINEIAINYNIYFIIMSATLPNFNQLKLNNDDTISYKTHNLLKNQDIYFKHYLFDRTEIKDNIIDLNINDDDFIDFYIDIINENFKQKYNKGLIVFNTIRSSKKVFELLKDKFEYMDDFNIILLNSSLLSYKKNQIINYLSNSDDNQKLIVVSTQSIEAGVDVSFDFVIRDFATLDSIEQVRGRCNRSRELNKKFQDEKMKGNIYITRIKDNNYIYNYIYDNDERNSRILESNNILNKSLTYDLSQYYKQVLENINNNIDKKENEFLKTDRDNILNLNNIHYSKLNDSKQGINIIDKNYDSYCLFVKTKIPIILNDDVNIEYMDDNLLKEYYENNSIEFIFSDKEIIYLRKKASNVFDGNYIDGEKFLDYYLSLPNEISKNDYVKIKLLNKEISSILDKFIINVPISDKDLKSDIENLKKINYFYIIDSDQIGDSEEHLYSDESGFNFNSILCNII